MLEREEINRMWIQRCIYSSKNLIFNRKDWSQQHRGRMIRIIISPALVLVGQEVEQEIKQIQYDQIESKGQNLLQSQQQSINRCIIKMKCAQSIASLERQFKAVSIDRYDIEVTGTQVQDSVQNIHSLVQRGWPQKTKGGHILDNRQ